MTMASDQDQNQNEPGHPDRIRTLFAEAIDLPESERTAFIEAQSPDDPRSRRRVPCPPRGTEPVR